MIGEGAAVVSSGPEWSEWMGTGLMVVIAIGIVLAIWMIVHRSGANRSTSDPINPTPRPSPVAETPVTDVLAEPKPAIADEPMPAAAAGDATPATLAADLATPGEAVPAVAAPAEAQAVQEPMPAPELPTAPSPAPVPAPTPTAEPDAADDLTRIKGLGPKLALKLGELGVTRYSQLADLTDEQARELDTRLGAFQGRMMRDRWVEQAGYLARGDRDGFEAAFGKL